MRLVGKMFVIMVLLFQFINCSISSECSLPEKLKEEIQSYGPVVDKIIETATKGSFRGKTYQALADFVDKFGSRLTGSKNLEDSIDYLVDLSKNHSLENIHTEDVDVPHWIRGEESAELIEPRHKKIKILTSGGSVGTPPQGIIADVHVMESAREMFAPDASTKFKGKVLVRFEKDIYARNDGPDEKRKYFKIPGDSGAAALLSVEQVKLPLAPTVRLAYYPDGGTKIPQAFIAQEDAHLLLRLQKRGVRLRMALKLGATMYPTAKSRNTIVEIQGNKQPEKFVILSGHVDSWDVGEGVVDDAGGVFVSWAPLVLLKTLGLRPQRTIRGIFWTGEEQGLIGAKAYQKAHGDEFKNMNFIMESDYGTFKPSLLEYFASRRGGCILKEVMQLFKSVYASKAHQGIKVLPMDISIWIKAGFPGGYVMTENGRYFWYYHSERDSMDVEKSEDLDTYTAIQAGLAYVLADLSSDFPRTD